MAHVRFAWKPLVYYATIVSVSLLFRYIALYYVVSSLIVINVVTERWVWADRQVYINNMSSCNFVGIQCVMSWFETVGLQRHYHAAQTTDNCKYIVQRMVCHWHDPIRCNCNAELCLSDVNRESSQYHWCLDTQKFRLGLSDSPQFRSTLWLVSTS